MIKRISAVFLLLFALTACDEPGGVCQEEGKIKHYSTGKVLDCENGKWVKKDGIGFER